MAVRLGTKNATVIGPDGTRYEKVRATIQAGRLTLVDRNSRQTLLTKEGVVAIESIDGNTRNKLVTFSDGARATLELQRCACGG